VGGTATAGGVPQLSEESVIPRTVPLRTEVEVNEQQASQLTIRQRVRPILHPECAE